MQKELKIDYNKPITDADYIEIMKFDNHDLDIADVNFQESTAEDIVIRFDIANILAEESSHANNC